MPAPLIPEDAMPDLCPWCLRTADLDTHQCVVWPLLVMNEQYRQAKEEHERTGPSWQPGGSDRWSAFLAVHPELLTDDDDLPPPF